MEGTPKINDAERQHYTMQSGSITIALQSRAERQHLQSGYLMIKCCKNTAPQNGGL
jgi:hypothetical protein